MLPSSMVGWAVAQGLGWARFHNILHRNKIRGHHNSLEGLERSLRDAGQQGGNSENTYLRFRPSEGLKNLRAQRRETRDARLRKSLTLTIRKNHRQEEVKCTIGTCKELANTSEHAICNQRVQEATNPAAKCICRHVGSNFCRKSRLTVPPSQSDRKPVVNACQCMNFNVRWVG